MDESKRLLAETIRSACVEAALAAYEDAKVMGLCHEGAWEYAIGQLRQLDARALAEEAERQLSAAIPIAPVHRRGT
jgi:hypothetical protein